VRVWFLLHMYIILTFGFKIEKGSKKKGGISEKVVGRSHVAYKSLSNRLLHDDKLVETIYGRVERWSNPSRE
ncbi:unnamed protein product, partial [Dovyalis caffra]